MEGNVKVRGGVGVERLRREHGLLVCRKLKLLKQDKTEDAELADIERRCLFTKYAICRTNINEDAAGALLQRELDHYTNIVDDRARLNNYWSQFDSLGVSTDNNPLDWKANLKELGGGDDAVPFLKALPCCDDNTTGCTRAQYTNKDVEKMVDLWRIGATSPGTRKTPVMPAKAFAHRNKEERQRRTVFLEQSTANEGPTIGKQSIALNKNVQCPVGEKREGQSDNKKKLLSFKSARELAQQTSVPSRPLGVKKSLGGRALNSPFVCPFKEEQPKIGKKMPDVVDERLKNIEPKMIELIKNEIMFGGSPISWDDIAGLEHVKKIIKEIVVFPMLRPDIFTGLRRPPKGILLFGPPGTGKTLIGKCIASQSKSTFFSISASSLTSKWIGEGEKMVRALFAVARVEQPSVVFIDEIDSLLCQRSETEHESSRRMKTEFLVQLDGAATGDEDRILVIGATNRPYELDEAARRRLVKRLYIPLPELTARTQIICNLLKTERNGLTDNEINEIAKLTDGYSGADMTNLCKEASMGPIRNIPFNQLENINKEDLREVTFLDFKVALDAVRPSVSPRDLSVYLDWDCTYGTACAQLH